MDTPDHSNAELARIFRTGRWGRLEYHRILAVFAEQAHSCKADSFREGLVWGSTSDKIKWKYQSALFGLGTLFGLFPWRMNRMSLSFLYKSFFFNSDLR
jgi:hypothetical protein